MVIIGFRLQLTLDNGTKITSPIIAPNGAGHKFNDPSVQKVIHNTGISMVKRLPDVVEYACIPVLA